MFILAIIMENSANLTYNWYMVKYCQYNPTWLSFKIARGYDPNYSLKEKRVLFKNKKQTNAEYDMKRLHHMQQHHLSQLQSDKVIIYFAQHQLSQLQSDKVIIYFTQFCD